MKQTQLLDVLNIIKSLLYPVMLAADLSPSSSELLSELACVLNPHILHFGEFLSCCTTVYLSERKQESWSSDLLLMGSNEFSLGEAQGCRS